MTFSIVAVDRKAREVGFAIASCCWDAGQVCMAKAEAGAIASQAQGNMAFLARFFDELAGAKSLAEILVGFQASDPEIESRQVGLISSAGSSLAFTGTRCTPWAGHRTGEGYAIQGNTLVGPRVVEAMEEAFQETEGRLHQRLVAALAAGDTAGGDLRGRQSARLVVRRKGCGHPGEDTLLDFTIEDHADPVTEVGRLLGLAREYSAIWTQFGTLSQATLEEKPAILESLRAMLDDKRDCRYLDGWESLGMAYHEIGDLDAAADAFRVYLEINPRMRPALEAGVDLGTLPHDLAARVLGD